ncbi:MAG: NAD(P)-dependent glycerol-3-phosphate dehydrogenase [Eubacteriales bacterium]|nr:NAD(P)-dependent glycerol-3-phosphate dehydrogenase [Eubacteriales bacterium]MDD3882938.1 NAD(P)-dependent glycerol-3-phosphate dehydrogenase [Eubacteriales bacterium]MDD4513515.1 NAD(P)-dependent glycerol-3-phosphate dehydrogenase [Eubacteriales bacterium]
MKCAVIGAGSWGTALAQCLADNGNETLLYARSAETVRSINESHINGRYFPNVVLNKTVKATDDVEAAAKGADAVVLAVPSKSIDDALAVLKPYLSSETYVINAAKGFDWQTNRPLTETIEESLGEGFRDRIVSLLGPSHAEEVVLRQITTICSVAKCESAARAVQRLFSNGYFRLYVLLDVIGAEYSAAMKNAIAIASGIAVGCGYGDNAKAALVTRGLREIVRYGLEKGGKKDTFFGLAGVGDLIVTCFSPHSRNYQAGLKIGAYDDAARFLAENDKTVEGINACKVIYEDTRALGLDMPIIEELYKVLFLGEKPSAGIAILMNRPLKKEELVSEIRA